MMMSQNFLMVGTIKSLSYLSEEVWLPKHTSLRKFQGLLSR